MRVKRWENSRQRNGRGPDMTQCNNSDETEVTFLASLSESVLQRSLYASLNPFPSIAASCKHGFDTVTLALVRNPASEWQ